MERPITTIILEKLVEKGAEGVTIYDFDDARITEETLADAIECLRYGIYADEHDDSLKFDG